MTIAIIGGGAAGYFAAIEAKRNCPSADITIFEKAPKMLAKVEITGGGRCNLTNSFRQISDVKHAYPRGHKLMKRLFKRFDHRSAYEWFEREGVGLTTQDDECVFPQSQDSHSIIDCLMGLAGRKAEDTPLPQQHHSQRRRNASPVLCQWMGARLRPRSHHYWRQSEGRRTEDARLAGT